MVAPLHVWLHLFHTCYSNSQTQTLCQHAVGLSHSPPSPNLPIMTFISHGSLLCCLRKIILSVLFQAFPSLVPRPLPDFISTAVRFISEWPGDEARPSPSPVLQCVKAGAANKAGVEEGLATKLMKPTAVYMCVWLWESPPHTSCNFTSSSNLQFFFYCNGFRNPPVYVCVFIVSTL